MMRRITSIIVSLTFIIISITGIMLLGEHRTGKSFVRIVSHIHEIAGILFIMAGMVHFKLNFKTMLAHIKRKN